MKKEYLRQQMKPLINDPEKMAGFIMENSNLPGPRGNLELAFAFAEIYTDTCTLLRWAAIGEEEAGVNEPKSFLAFCAAVCMGKRYTETGESGYIDILKKLSCDNRWRMREAVAFAFQIIGEKDFSQLASIFIRWIDSAGNLERRAILVSLAHPPFLNPERAAYCLQITDRILKNPDREGKGFDVLRKGLDFTISVFVAAGPETGFEFIGKWIGKDPVIDRIIRQNLKKNRLAGKYAGKVKKLLNLLNEDAL